MGKKPIKPGQLKRVGGLVMISMSVGMLFAWVFPSFSIVAILFLLIFGFYFLFM